MKKRRFSIEQIIQILAEGRKIKIMLFVKDKCLNLNTFENIEETKEIISNYIDFESRKRPHSSLNYKIPVEFERSLIII